MPTMTIEYRDDAERLALEQAVAYVSHLRQLAHATPSGGVLDACEQLALSEGRALLRSTLASALQGRIAEAEQKGGRRGCARRRTPDATRAATSGPCLRPSGPSA